MNALSQPVNSPDDCEITCYFPNPAPEVGNIFSWSCENLEIEVPNADSVTRQVQSYEMEILKSLEGATVEILENEADEYYRLGATTTGSNSREFLIFGVNMFVWQQVPDTLIAETIIRTPNGQVMNYFDYMVTVEPVFVNHIEFEDGFVDTRRTRSYEGGKFVERSSINRTFADGSSITEVRYISLITERDPETGFLVYNHKEVVNLVGEKIEDSHVRMILPAEITVDFGGLGSYMGFLAIVLILILFPLLFYFVRLRSNVSKRI